MSGYFGSEAQMRMQRCADESAVSDADRPGACKTGRLYGCDDIEALGWPAILDTLARDGALGFRMIASDVAPELVRRLGDAGYRVDFWDVFAGGRDEVLAAVDPIVGEGLPSGFVRVPIGDDPEGSPVRAFQSLAMASGVVPFSGSMLVGRLGPAATVALADDSGAVVATAHGYLPHNRHSRHHRWAWGGLVAVAPVARGKGLGRLVNAMMVREAVVGLGAEMVYELVSATNQVSRRMVEAAGLRLDPTLKCGIALPAIAGGRVTA